MSQRRDKGKQKSVPTSTAGEESSQAAAPLVPPQSTFQSQLAPGVSFGAAEASQGRLPPRPYQTSRGSASSGSSVTRDEPTSPTTPTRGPTNLARRPPGVAPLAKILLQEGEAENPPELSPLRLQEETSPTRTRSAFFDPARSLSASEEGVTTSTSRTYSGYPSQAGPSRLGQPVSGGFPSSTSHQISSSTAASFSAVDLDRLRLEILQQPRAARACGYGERDRRVVDPPPILQLKLENYNPGSQSDREILRSPFNLVNCLLFYAPSWEAPISECRDVSSINDPADPSGDTKRLLMGSLATSPFIGQDVYATALPKEARIGTYYIFSDLSCRRSGLYRLQFLLTPVSISSVSPHSTTPVSRPVTSDVFEVFSAKDFPGMSASSELTKELKRQGASVPVKKGNEGKSSRKGKKRGSDSDGSSSDG